MKTKTSVEKTTEELSYMAVPEGLVEHAMEGVTDPPVPGITDGKT